MPEPKNGRIGGGVLKDNLEIFQGGAPAGRDFLNFKSNTPDTALLHIDAAGSRIGIRTESPTFDLQVPNNIGSVNFVAADTNIANKFDISNNRIDYFTGTDLLLSAGTSIQATSIATDDLLFDYNTISTRTENTNIELRPDGTGAINIRSDWNSTGGIHATGNITFGGNFVIGDGDEDDIVFAADVNSDIMPDANNTYSLGSAGSEFLSIYSNLLNGDAVIADEVILSDNSLARRQGNIFYVSTLGNDTNVGDHQHGAFRTLQHALSVVDASSAGPVTIHVYPGEYEEVFPLVVPERVTISGHDIRNTIITPTAGTNTQNAFEINQNVTIENITIKDFFSPGYAFAFASGATITERSPYIRNVTVITQGSVTSVSDPRGFDAGDAGKGALIDGSVLDSSSPEGSMLFHSATFITPGVDCITLTNGVRAEWLNSFTYYANRSLYATQGALGLGSNGSRFGAEIRSIGSASIYGNYGAEADGADTLMYLIGHNFAYIGNGKNKSNDNTLTIEANEAVEINNGKIYFTSTDATGKFKVGDAFFADYETGTTSIDASGVDFSGISQIVTRSGEDITFIDGSRIDTGNIRISGNTITTIDGELVLDPVTELFNTDNNPTLIISNGTDLQRTDVEGSIRYNTDTNLFEGYSSGNLSFGGIYSDDRATSLYAHKTNNTIIFNANNVLTGTLDATKLSLNGLSDGDILFDNNLITTTESNSNLELRRNGVGIIEAFDIDLRDENFINTSNNTFIVTAAGQGYIKFDSSTGLVIPFGNTASQSPSPELGETRWNTDDDQLETWNGEEWQRSAGEGQEVTDVVLKELVDVYTMVLG